MSLLGYAAFWLAALALVIAVLDFLYGRLARKVMRVLLSDGTPDEPRPSARERFHLLLDKLFAFFRR